MSKIDAEKIQQYQELHKKDPSYGSTSLKFIDEVSVMIDHLSPSSILDYGCGKGTLITEVEKRYPNIKCYRYDPSIPEFSTLPTDAVDMVLNTDVLEHIPEQDIDDVLAGISAISTNVYFNLHHALAATILPSGENAHCTVKTPRWYRKKIRKYFDTVNILPGRRHITSVCTTFDIPDEVRGKYLKIIRKNKVRAPVNLRLRYSAKTLLKDWFGIMSNK